MAHSIGGPGFKFQSGYDFLSPKAKAIGISCRSTQMVLSRFGDKTKQGPRWVYHVAG